VKSMDKEMILGRKGEVVGNLVAASLSGGGVESFSFGEFFEAKYLVKIVEPTISVRQQVWCDGVAYNFLMTRGVELEERLVVYNNTLVYTISNRSPLKLEIKLRGDIEVFSWFNPNYRDKIAEMASVLLEFSDKHLIGS